MKVVLTIIVSLFLTSCATTDKNSALTERGFDVVKKDLSEVSRVALVIGNNEYEKPLTTLNNPINDAKAIKSILETRGFEVIYRENTSKREFRETLEAFYQKIRRGAVGLLYFAGHGIEVGGQNYLIPTNAKLKKKLDAEFESIALNRITKNMQDANNKLNIVILDACRNDPFARTVGEGGLAKSEPIGLFVSYATKAGKVAQDGEVGTNGLFTKYLMHYMQQPLTLQEVFQKTRASVYQASSGVQFPAVYDNTINVNFYFTKPNNKIPNSQTTVPSINTNNIQVDLSNDKILALKKACDLNDGEACGKLAEMYYFGDTEIRKDLNVAIGFSQKACQLNHGQGCNLLGIYYGTGEIVSIDKTKAILLFQKACDLNSGNGCNNLGHAYYFGKGIPKDLLKAKRFYKKSCDLNYGQGCRSLGDYIYLEENKLDLSRKFNKKSCDLGDGSGCSSVGVGYLKKDSIVAKKFFDKGCKLNSGNACTNLGSVYANEQNFSTAKKFFQKGCKLNDAKGCRYLGTLPNEKPEIVSNSVTTQWITPTNTVCQRNGGKINSRGVCTAKWSDAKNICHSMGGKLPTLSELEKVVVDCGGIHEKGALNQSNSLYKSCYKKIGFGSDFYWSSKIAGTDKNNDKVVFQFNYSSAKSYGASSEGGYSHVHCMNEKY